MIAGVTGIAADVIPFGFALGQRGELVGINIVGLKRRGVGRKDMLRLRQAYRALFESGGTFRERFESVAADFSNDPIVGKIIAFITEGGSKPLMKAPAMRSVAADSDD